MLATITVDVRYPPRIDEEGTISIVRGDRAEITGSWSAPGGKGSGMILDNNTTDIDDETALMVLEAAEQLAWGVQNPPATWRSMGDWQAQVDWDELVKWAIAAQGPKQIASKMGEIKGKRVAPEIPIAPLEHGYYGRQSPTGHEPTPKDIAAEMEE